VDLATTIADDIMEDGWHPISCYIHAAVVYCRVLARQLPLAAERMVEEGRWVEL
jgi:hypothetical protein